MATTQGRRLGTTHPSKSRTWNSGFLTLCSNHYANPCDIVTDLQGTRLVDRPGNRSVPRDGSGLKQYYFNFVLLTRHDSKAQRNAEQR